MPPKGSVGHRDASTPRSRTGEGGEGAARGRAAYSLGSSAVASFAGVSAAIATFSSRRPDCT